MSALARLNSRIEELHRIRTDPVWYAENVLNLTGDKYYLDVWQKETMQAMADVYRKRVGMKTLLNHDGKTMFTIRAMHGPGKTFTIASVMHWFNDAFRGRIICTAPKEKQLATRLWPAFRKVAVRAGPDYSSKIKVDSTKIVWHGDEDWCALAETASQPENLAGYHDDYMLVVVDEASGVSEAMFPVIEGMVSTGVMVMVVLIGNPTKNQGSFYASHMIPRVARHYYQIHVDLAKTTRVSREWVERMESKYGRNSPVVKVRCYGEFADSDEYQLIAYAWLTEAAAREDVDTGDLPRLRITVDVSDGGADFSVFTVSIIRGNKIRVLKQLQRSYPTSEATILTANKAEALFKEYGGKITAGDDIVVDSLGVGAGTAGTLIERGYPVITYKGGESSDNPALWRNRRTQSYLACRDSHRDGLISYADDFLAEREGEEGDWDDFTAQMCSIRLKQGTERLEELITKKEMKADGLPSPDRADSIAMIFATQAPHIPVALGAVATVDSTVSSQGEW